MRLLIPAVLIRRQVQSRARLNLYEPTNRMARELGILPVSGRKSFQFGSDLLRLTDPMAITSIAIGETKHPRCPHIKV